MNRTHTVPRFFVIAAISAVLFASLTPAASAYDAKYCDNRLVTTGVYTNVNSNGSRSQVVYFMRLQNQSGQPINHTIRFTAPQMIEAQTGGLVSVLAPYQQVTYTLGKRNVNNPSGAGALSYADAAKYIQVVCR